MRALHSAAARVGAGAVACLTLLAAACGPTPSPKADDLAAPLLDSSDGKDWPAPGRTYGEQHFSPLKEINADNVGRLGLAWSLDLDLGNAATQPIEVNGTIYFSRFYSVIHAVDAVTGKELWTYDPKAPEAAGGKLRTNWGSRGIAYWNGKVYVGTVDGRLIAVDAKTGKEVWSTLTVPKGDGRNITGAPRVFDGKIIIGHAGADIDNIRGYVTAYNAETGKQLWRFYTVPGNPADGFENDAMKMAAKTWAGEWWKFGGGGSVWNAITYDAEQDLIYIGTGNGHPWNWRVRSAGKGDNLFLCSMIALDAKTGAYRWHYQFNPGETWDYNAVMDMQLATLNIDGQPRKVVMTTPKNGFFYVIDRTNGKLISAEPIVKVNWASKIDLETGRPVETPGVRYENGTTFTMRPGAAGGHTWLPMAFSPQTNLVYVPTLNFPTSYSDAGIDTATWKTPPGFVGDGAVNMGLSPNALEPEDNTSALVAWNPVTQKAVWRQKTPGQWGGGVVATAGNVVFGGQLDHKFNAYDATNGEILWSFDAHAPVIAPPITYEVNGTQYVTVIAGAGAGVGALAPLMAPFKVDYRGQKRRMLTFAIDAKAALPNEDFVGPLPPIDDPDYRADPAAAERGAKVFAHCWSCHGGSTPLPNGTAPDLRASPMPLSAEAFQSVVRDGALIPHGMPSFEEFTDQQLADVRQFIRSEAAKARSEKANPVN